MTIREDDLSLLEKGKKDAARHRKKIKDAIRERTREIIAETPIITQKGKKIVKIPVQGIKSYHFKDREEGQAGIGQGQGEKGDKVDREAKQGKQPGKAGNEPGIDYFETEIDLEEFVQAALEEMGLPDLQKKDIAQIPIIRGWKPDHVDKHGIRPNVLKKKSVKQAIKRTAQFVGELMKETGQDKEYCAWALSKAKGNLKKAKEILQQGKFPPKEKLGETRPYLYNEDLRYKVITPNVDYESNAVVFAMMDTSGSMTEEKKYVARIFFWWMVQFLRIKYQNVEIKFIAHDTWARLVEEEDFFRKGENGGTHCYTAYNLAYELTQEEYKPEEWNIYVFHFSDGEDWNTLKTAEAVKKLLPRCNMIGYGEILSHSSALLETLQEELQATKTSEDPLVIEKKDDQGSFMGIVIESKEAIWTALKRFFRLGGER